MNYRGYMKAEDREALEQRDARRARESWVRVCAARWAAALENRASRRQQAARLAELVAAIAAKEQGE